MTLKKVGTGEAYQTTALTKGGEGGQVMLTHFPHMADREDGVEHSALLSVMVSCNHAVLLMPFVTVSGSGVYL